MVPAIKFLTDFLWVEQDEQKAIIKVLQLILSPNAISTEASVMLASVKKIVAKPLDIALQNYVNKRDPTNKEVQPVLNSLKDSVPMTKRTGHADMSEANEWCKAEPHGLWTALRNTTQGLMVWAMQQPTVQIMPTTYTHRQFILGIKLMGPDRVLKLILEEVQNQTRTDLVSQPSQERISVVYDVATALICAPNVRNEPPAPSTENPPTNLELPMQRSLSLRDALRLEADRCREIQKRDVVMADIIVLLYKRVEQQMTLPQGMPDMNQMLNPNGGLDAGLGNDVSLDAVMQNMQNNRDATLDLGNADNGGLGLTGDLGGELSGGDGMDAFGAEIPMGTGNDAEDIFGGLDTNLEGMDMDTIDWGEGGLGI